MSYPRQRRLAGLLLGLITAGAPALGASPEELLKGRGLKQSGSVFVLPGEEDFIRRVKGVEPLYDRVEETYKVLEKQAEVMTTVEGLDSQRINMDATINTAQAQLDAMPLRGNSLIRMQRAELARVIRDNKVSRAEVVKNLKLTEKDLIPPRRLNEVREQFKVQATEFVNDAGRIWPVYEQIMKDYGNLKSDESATGSLKALRSMTKTQLSFGPSEGFNGAVKHLRTAERTVAMYLPDRKQGSRSPSKPGALAAARPDPSKAKDQIVLAREGLKTLNFGRNAGRNALKRHAVEGLNVALNELNSGTVTADRFGEVRKDIDSLLNLKPMSPENFEILKQASENISAAVDSIQAR